MLLFGSAILAQEWQPSFEIAQTKAKHENKPVLLVFSGSDWCAPCIKLDQNIWASTPFKTHAKTAYSLYKADFPRKKQHQLAPAFIEQNQKLAERYNPKGHFPLVLVLNSEGQVLGRTGYRKISPEKYIKHLNAIIK